MNPISTQNSEHYKWADICDGWHLLKSENLSVIEELVPPGSTETLHYHCRAEQFFYVLSGQATMIINDSRKIIESFSGIYVPKNAKHQLINETDQALRFLVISTPPSHGDRVDIE
ncbi:cupin domain-containing protein [Marinicellulosiphila megalodicopiae]|uniref:cupin domain-containing protein n=1 Tax=Marinicellulosiphila megalodicopiae TaxID=2724896 RepID=UPI003BAEA5DF